MLGIEAIPTVPGVPVSHPFVERLIRTIRQESLDQLLFWNATDFARKLEHYQGYDNGWRRHQGLAGDTPHGKAGAPSAPIANLANYRWHEHCQGLVEPPIAA